MASARCLDVGVIRCAFSMFGVFTLASKLGISISHDGFVARASLRAQRHSFKHYAEIVSRIVICQIGE